MQLPEKQPWACRHTALAPPAPRHSIEHAEEDMRAQHSVMAPPALPLQHQHSHSQRGAQDVTDGSTAQVGCDADDGGGYCRTQFVHGRKALHMPKQPSTALNIM